MRINKIKIAGFKSFVDPTTIEFPGSLSAIVGPNGCGKSNIVDAMLWVLGESSAKHLRGDSMADVIFNGSATRKPVGLASVEVILDNTDGKIGGQYAAYNEIAIKRQVGRDGLSTYYLNGARCRRRDITHLFLGTGIGSRTYSVIEQGTISRVIEAKPEDLRLFLEEAAGISKYKDRRRETETRIGNTRENLARVTDIFGELDKQLQHLQRQARAAERYQALKQEERFTQAQLLAQRWQALKKKAGALQKEAEQRANGVEATTAALRGVENDIVQERESQAGAAERFNSVQSAFYQVGAEVARVEQQIQHHQERRQVMVQELAQAENATTEARQLIDEDERRIARLREELERLAPLQTELRDKETRAQAEGAEAESAISEWEQRWDALNRQLAEAQRHEHVEQTRLEHLEDGLESARARLHGATLEQRQLEPGAIAGALAKLANQVMGTQGNYERLLSEHEASQRAMHSLREDVHRLAARLDDLRQQRQVTLGRIASLEALQQSALGTDRPAVAEWLRQSGLSETRRLSESMQVEGGWEHAAETACRIPLYSLCMEELNAVLAALPSLREGTAAALETRRAIRPNAGRSTVGLPPLASKVRAPWPVTDLFRGVYAAETLEAALDALACLADHESVITRDGIWLGCGWVTANRETTTRSGLLLRASELRTLAAEGARLETEVSACSATLAQTRTRLDALEQEDGLLRQRLTAAHESLAASRSDVAAGQARLQQTRERLGRLAVEIDELEQQVRDDEDERQVTQDHVQRLRAEWHKLERRRQTLLAERDRRRAALGEARARWQATRDEAHSLQVKAGTLNSERNSLEQAIGRNQTQLDRVLVRVAELRDTLEGCNEPLAQLQSERESLLVRRLQVEGDLAQTREAVQQIDAQLRQLEQQRLTIERELGERRDELEQARVEARGFDIRLEGLRDQIGALGYTLEQICETLPPEGTETQLEEHLGEIDRKIQRLGPINLAAIDECATLSERKQYLDRQHADLTEALSTLEEAIRKIDRETRTRFRETYDRVNTGFQTLFPVLFGGGHAYLELTGDDLLETGVTVMARPPGKRNSTIHLLSGGEKALTAVALVFAIFELNPAPFCLLDEVDAPLDDANVVRLSEMLKERARDIQFVFVTHNKITMEIAEQLIGVTMQEAGVSRLVSVNMEEAVRLAATV
ncbi:MAG: chromosome segregation protein SMC [Chromatiales bacterium]